jgi:hypothetical protein
MIESEIIKVQTQFLVLFHNQLADLETWPSERLIDLQHRSGELRMHKDFSMRVSGEVNFAATSLILEKR